MKHQSCWGFFGFQEAMSEPAGKAKKLTACHLMPHNKHLGKQGCNFQFRKHKIFNPWKTRSVNFRPSALFTCNCIHFYIIHLLLIRYSLFYMLFSICVWLFFLFCFVVSNSFCFLFILFIRSFNIRLLSIIFVLILEMCSRYFDPHYNNHLASQ
jgi:hypothetical protein